MSAEKLRNVVVTAEQDENKGVRVRKIQNYFPLKKSESTGGSFLFQLVLGVVTLLKAGRAKYVALDINPRIDFLWAAM